MANYNNQKSFKVGADYRVIYTRASAPGKEFSYPISSDRVKGPAAAKTYWEKNLQDTGEKFVRVEKRINA